MLGMNSVDFFFWANVLAILVWLVEHLILPHVQVQDHDDEDEAIIKPLPCRKRRRITSYTNNTLGTVKHFTLILQPHRVGYYDFELSLFRTLITSYTFPFAHRGADGGSLNGRAWGPTE